MPVVTVTNPAANELVFTAPSLVGASTPRLGQAQREFTSNNFTLQEPVFFKFYTCSDASSPKVYTPLDVSAAFANATVMERMTTMLFLAFYQNATLVSELATSFTPLAQRLANNPTPTTPLASTLTMPASSSNFVEFVSMGLGSFIGAGLINANSAYDGAPSPWGTRVGQVVLTATDPLGTPPIEALYDNSDSGCWDFANFNCDGIVVYTNLVNGAFAPTGLAVWSQVACVWPVIALVKNAQFACIFNTLDASFMRSGLGYFDRAARRDTYFGWAGNYIQSIFNDWGIPLISPLWGVSDFALGTILHNTNPVYLPNELDNPSILYRFIGPRAAQNISVIKEKTARSALPLLWTESCIGLSLTWMDLKTAALGYPSTQAYIAACLGATSEGYNAHLYQSILQSAYGGFSLATVRGWVNGGVSWSAKLAAQPSMADALVDASGNPLYYAPAYGSFYPGGGGSYRQQLLAQIETYTLGMTLAQEALVEGWLYTP
jgi:hypothetical protein